MKEYDLLVLVPARGGSKGLPRKNTRWLGDIPLLGWTAQAVFSAEIGTTVSVVLSTDDAEIAALGRDVGLDVPFLRPAELATDTASVVDVALHALEWYEKNRQLSHAVVMLLQPTSPFRHPESLATAVAMLQRDNLDGVIGVKPIYRSLSTLFRTGDQGQLVSMSDSTAAMRRQETEPLYTPNGALYLVSADVLRNERSFFPRRSAGLVMDQIASIDIDDPVDWALAEAVVRSNLAWRCC